MSTLTKKLTLKGKSPKLAEPAKLKMGIFGPAGVGKTMGSLDWPGVFFIDSEGGANLPHYTDKLVAAEGVYFGPEDGSNDFDAINEQMDALTTLEHPHRTMVLDSFTKVYNTSIGLEAERLGDKDAFGASKKPAVAGARRFINKLDRLPMNAVVILHEKAEWGVDSKGDRAEIGKTFDGYDKLAYELNLILHIQKRGSSRVAVVKKSRLLGFPEGSTIPWNFDEIANRYGRDVIEKKEAPLVLATPEQVAELKRLLEIVKMEEGELDKWLAKAKAETVEQFTLIQADKCIDALKKKLA